MTMLKEFACFGLQNLLRKKRKKKDEINQSRPHKGQDFIPPLPSFDKLVGHFQYKEIRVGSDNNRHPNSDGQKNFVAKDDANLYFFPFLFLLLIF